MLLTMVTRNEAQCEEAYLRIRAFSEASDQPAHSRNLIRIFTGRTLDSKNAFFLFIWTTKILIRLYWMHMSESTLSYVAAQIMK